MSSLQKKGIIVLGCHRSGTSAITGLLKLYDVHLGTDLLQPGADNPKGFFEHRKIVRLNDCFMDHLNHFVDNTDTENILTIDFDAWKSGKVSPQEDMKSLERMLGISSLNKQPSDKQIKEYLSIS